MCQWSAAKNWVIGTHDANDNGHHDHVEHGDDVDDGDDGGDDGDVQKHDDGANQFHQMSN